MSGSYSSRNRIQHTMATELPKTLDQLFRTSTISRDDQRIRCGICQERYLNPPEKEKPVELPGCKHMFGRKCISTWLETGNNSCPMCRRPILDATPVINGDRDNRHERGRHDQWRRELKDWQTTWSLDYHPDILVHNDEWETQFWDLCEAIVKWIEDPSLTSPREWLRLRMPYRQIIALGSFTRFSAVMNGPPGNLQTLAHELRNLLPNPQAFERVMEGIGSSVRPRTVEWRNVERYSTWSLRIAYSHADLYRRCYGVSVFQDDPSP